MFSRSAKRIYKDLQLYTNDIIIKKLAKNWIVNNSYYKFIYDAFGIKIRKHFKLKVKKQRSKYSHKIITRFELSCGLINTNKFILKEC